jgi:energy-coupling factor transporter ATP-binding protein EcfA2
MFDTDTECAISNALTSRESLLIIAPSGSGKTTACLSLFDTCKDTIRFLRPCYDVIRNHQDFVEIVENFLYSSLSAANDTSLFPSLFLDDIDILFSQDRYSSGFIKNLIGQRTCSVIMTCSSGQERRATEIKKICKIVRPKLPDVVTLCKLVGADPANDDVQRTIKTLNYNVAMVLQFYNTGLVDTGEHLMYHDKNIYEIVQCIFTNKDRGIQDIEIAIAHDPTLISFIMYDNYKEYMRIVNMSCHILENSVSLVIFAKYLKKRR